MSATTAPSFRSRTTPTKLAIAPILGLPRRMAAISAPTSKSAACTRTGTSASGYRRKKSHFIAVADRRSSRRHVLIDGNAHRPAWRKFPFPGVSATAQPGAQAGDILYLRWQLDLLTRAAECLA